MYRGSNVESINFCVTALQAGVISDVLITAVLPAASAAALREGWLHTGDLGSLDSKGQLRVFERRSDLIVSGGENVYPAEIEAALVEHPAVAAAGVAGVPDAEFGQRPVAWIVPATNAAPSIEALREHCAARLAAFKVPLRFHCVAQLPCTAAGKVQRHLLRESPPRA